MGITISISVNGWNTQHTQKGFTDKTIKSFVLVVLNIRKAFVPCTWMLKVVNFEYMYNNHAKYLHMYNQLGRLGVRHGPNVEPKDTQEPIVLKNKIGLRLIQIIFSTK
jgi:hypothetical protein